MKKNIWILHHYATPNCMSGLTRPYNFGLKMKAQGYKVRVFASAFLHYSEENLIEDKSLYLEQDFDGVPFVFVRTTPYSGNGVSRVKNLISFYFNLQRTVLDCVKKYGKPDVIYASSPHLFTCIAGIRMAKKLNVESICEVRDLWPEAIFTVGKCSENSLIGRVLTMMEHWIYKKSGKLIFTKEGDVDYIKEHKWDEQSGGKIDLSKVNYVNNGVDITLFNKEKNEFVFQDSDLDDGSVFKVVYVGAIRLVNNVGNILDCAKLLKDKNIKFLIFGDGNELEMLEERLKTENIGNVCFKGRVDRKYIPNILSKSDLNILNYSSTMYNWSRGNSSNKLFEYMASGKPVLSTVKMGYSIIEKYSCGFELKESTPELFAQKILECYSMSEEERKVIGNNALVGANDFDFNVLAKRLINVIEK